MSSPAVGCRGYADLARQQVEGTDYKVHVRANAQSSIAVIAPHGGGIEGYTSDIARAIVRSPATNCAPSRSRYCMKSRTL